MVKPSKKIERDIARLERFRDLFSELFDGPEPRPGLVQEVAIAAGESRQAYADHDGRMFPVQDDIYLTPNATPMTHWKSAFHDASDLDPMTVVAAVDLAIGRAQQRLEESREREKGVVGLIAAILRWPSDLREAVGPSPGQKRAAQALGVIGQILVGACATAVGAGVIQLAVWGYQVITAALR
ncbi:hypothetical protein [Microbacterium paludicola]|uniref:hypothetical protein n=1 Tax=Microbacterium paludicola TaxID=300019 RepID=UPI0009031997|nr:hypothetical protein [Microbacterium paludicola]APF34907.1 hypothetical protein BO218_12520 [Microbacterium paludicola]